MSGYLSREPVLQVAGFVGRQVELAWLADMLGRPSPQNCNLVGEPRIGKSSLLMQTAARRLGIPPGEVGLHVGLRLAELPDYRAVTFWREMLLRLAQAQQTAGLNAAVETALPAASADDARSLFDALDETVDLLLTATVCRRIFFLIDDFDLLLPGFASRDLDWLRALATRYTESLAFVITSSDSLVTLSDKLLRREEIETPVSPFANMFHNRALALLTADEAEQLCQETAVAERQPTLLPADVAFLLREVGRHPALLKMALSYFFEARQYAQSEEVWPIVADDIRLDEQARWLCRQLWQRRTPAEQAILAALPGADGEPEPILLNRLKKHIGVVEERNGRTVLFADLFAYWLRREFSCEGEAMQQAAVLLPPTDEFTYLADKRLLYMNNNEIKLTALEGRLLDYLLAHKNDVCTVDELLAHVWGDGKTRFVVEKAINRLRLKVEPDPKRPRFLLSARGEGYMLRVE